MTRTGYAHWTRLLFHIHKLFATYTTVESEVAEFINFARSERSPVTIRMMQDRALTDAERLGYTQFKESLLTIIGNSYLLPRAREG